MFPWAPRGGRGSGRPTTSGCPDLLISLGELGAEKRTWAQQKTGEGTLLSPVENDLSLKFGI